MNQSDKSAPSPAACAHVRVKYAPINNGDGTLSDAWVCDAGCGKKFWPETGVLSYEHRETVCAAHRVHLCGTCFPNPPAAQPADEPTKVLRAEDIGRIAAKSDPEAIYKCTCQGANYHSRKCRDANARRVETHFQHAADIARGDALPFDYPLEGIQTTAYTHEVGITSWKCKARTANTGANDPQECDWPRCGCDPYADKVITAIAIEESGYQVTPAAPSGDWATQLAGEIVGLCSAWFDGRRGFNSKDAEFTKVRVAPLITQAVNLQVGAAYLACAENIKKSRAFITQLHVWFERQFGESTEVQRSKAQHVLDILEAAAGEIGRLTPEAAARALQEHDAKLQIEAIEQCAIEAGERSPEGVSSHTMLGDMWDERVTKLRAALSGAAASSDEQKGERG